MYQSILHFIANDVKEIEKIIPTILGTDGDFSDLSREIFKHTDDLARRIIVEILQLLDEEIFKSLVRKRTWHVEHKDEKREILDVHGSISFSRRGYVPKDGGSNIYLLDEIIGLTGHQKVTLNAAAKMLEEAVTTSYEKGGQALECEEKVSRQTVKELVHATEFYLPDEEPKEKKELKILHAVADEDHVSAQFWKEKGDLGVNGSGNKINTLMPKIIVLYEDVVDDAPEGSKKHRYRLVGKKTFCGIYKGEKNYDLWQEVQDYIDTHYDTDVLERVYISGDGAAWIKAGTEIVIKSRFVLDKFHLMKYINTSVVHLENADEMKEYIWECVNGCHKKELRGAFDNILEVTESENKYKEVEDAKKYLLNNWKGIEIRKEESSGIWKCCAEGQVSHVLSARLSSRPMGWSERGCDRMARFRAYKNNGGEIIDLLKYQHEKELKEEQREKRKELIEDIKKRQKDWKYQEALNAAIPGLDDPDLKWLKFIAHQLEAI